MVPYLYHSLIQVQKDVLMFSSMNFIAFTFNHSSKLYCCIWYEVRVHLHSLASRYPIAPTPLLRLSFPTLNFHIIYTLMWIYPLKSITEYQFNFITCQSFAITNLDHCNFVINFKMESVSLLNIHFQANFNLLAFLHIHMNFITTLLTSTKST